MKPDDLTKKIDPYTWYPREYLADLADGDNRTLSAFGRRSPHLIPQRGSPYTLGATVLNHFAVHRSVELPPTTRFLDPLLFATSLETTLSSLAHQRHGASPLLRFLKGRQDYVVDMLYLHHFRFDDVIHSGLEKLAEKELITRYKLSGFHSDYGDEIRRRNDKWVNSLALHTAILYGLADSKSMLEGAGFLGLIESARKYIPGEVSLRKFARLRVRGAMIDYLREASTMTRVEISKQKEINLFRRSFERDYGREPTYDEIKEEFKINDAIGGYLMTDDSKVISLDERIGDSGTPYLDMIADDEHAFDEFRLDTQNEIAFARRAVSLLPPPDQRFIYLRFYEEKQLKEIGVEMGYTEARATQREAEILGALRVIINKAQI
jgi:RNA polymerase sigma factor FliA